MSHQPLSLAQSLGQTVVGTAYVKVADYLTTKGDDSTAKRIGKSIVTALPNALFAVALTVEAAVRLVLTALAKLAHFFMPKNADFTRSFEKYVLIPLAVSTAVNGSIAGLAGKAVGMNFMNADQRGIVEEGATLALEALFKDEGGQPNAVVKAIGSFANFVANVHIDGVSSSNSPRYEQI